MGSKMNIPISDDVFEKHYQCIQDHVCFNFGNPRTWAKIALEKAVQDIFEQIAPDMKPGKFVLMEEDYGGMFSSHPHPTGLVFNEEDAKKWVADEGACRRSYVKIA